MSRRLLNSDFSLSRCQHIPFGGEQLTDRSCDFTFFVRQGVLGKSLLAN